MIYEKLPSTIDQQIKKLQERGMNIGNIPLAKKYLSSLHSSSLEEDDVGLQYRSFQETIPDRRNVPL
ncbi:MAG: hypothetical protein RLQ12_20215 [Cyclobacteriaceae bacterium]